MSADVLQRLNKALSGRYRLEREVGAGGMATVYLAQDERHARPVALKVLKPELAAVVGADRFLTEIRTTANLQHPHILALFDSGEADSFLYYVMPYVEGDTLRDLLDREKQLPVDDAVRIAKAVASALDYAHRHNVIHRDIKPANILLHDGQPVVADFGIALAVQQAGGGRLTETGLSLGTPYYMSPEQATADRDPGPRSDVYSLGCVLYEMLAGEPPFQGGTAQAVLGRILTGDTPSITEVRRTVPHHIDVTITRSLERLPADRFATAADFSDALSRPDLAASPAGGQLSAPTRGLRLLPWGIAAAATLALLGSWMTSGSDSTPAQPALRSFVELQAGAYLNGPNPVVSSDGRQIVLEARVGGQVVLVHRAAHELDFQVIPGSVGATVPTLSPDGGSVVYRLGSLMVRQPVAGGPPQVLGESGNYTPGDWAKDGYIYFTPSYRSGVQRIPVDGGAVEVLTEPDDARGELAHWWPRLLPDGEHVLFTIFRTPIDSAEIAVVSLTTGEMKTVHQGGVSGRYVDTGHLIYARNSALFAVPFDLDAMEVSGSPVVVVEDMLVDHVNGRGSFSLSENGTFIYVSASEYDAPGDLVWVNRSGAEEPVLAEARVYSDPAISPDERRLAMTITEPGEAPDVWVLELARGTLARITSGGGADFAPVWSTDGRDLIFSSEQPVFDLFIRPADGSRPAEPLVADEFDKYPTVVRNGTLTYMWETIPENVVLTLALDGSGTADTVFTSFADLENGSVSPDERWLAYTTDESGRYEVYVSSYPDATVGRRQISSGGGREARWIRGGRELVYRAGPDMMSVGFDLDTGEPQTPQVLFSGDYRFTDRSLRSYDVTADGERFVMTRLPPERTPRRVFVIANFPDKLKGIQPE